ncbi:MAG: DUF456 domain-containing protein [Candidatus Eisenbacteria bacterium]|jgi:hypothetical protein|nr:DUF456 domain-containing protein [Candidatus Eisenbacteria bacterium]
MNWWEIVLLVPLALSAAVGVVGSVLPLLPGPPIILAAGAGYAWATGFRFYGSPTIIALAVLTAVSLIFDSFAGAAGAAGAGASRKAIIAATVLAAVGFLAGPLWLVFVLPLIGVAAVERLTGRTSRQALKAAAGVGIGSLLTTVVRLAISLAMAVLIVVGLLT